MQLEDRRNTLKSKYFIRRRCPNPNTGFLTLATPDILVMGEFAHTPNVAHALVRAVFAVLGTH